MISFNGISSDDLGLIVEKYPARPVPKRKEQKWSVAGRNGDVLATENAWENVTRTYECYISAEFRTGGLQRAADRIAEWLQAASWAALWDDYDDDTYVVAHFSGPVDIDNIINKFGRIKLSFDCWPQRFLTSGSEPIELTGADSIENPTGFIAQPLIVLSGTSAGGTLRVGTTGTTDDPIITIASGISPNIDGVVIDCREQEVYRSGYNLNSYASGTIPDLLPGTNYISWGGGISGITITPRWWRI